MSGHKDVVQLLLDANADIGALKTPVRVRFLELLPCAQSSLPNVLVC